MNVIDSPEPLPLISKEKKKYVKKCINCQNRKDKKGDSKLTSTEASRNVITEVSKSLKDDLLHGLRDADKTNIKYHINIFYANFRKKKERLKIKRTNDTSSSTTFFVNTETPNTTCSRSKIAETVDHKIPHVKNCIICNQNICRGDSRKLCICETRGAKQLLSAIKFNKDEVFTKCILCKIVGDTFASDVMQSKNCMTNYVLKFQNDVPEILK